MGNLTDLEICQKIAEINGDNVTLQIPESCGCYLYDEDNECEYDPLTDDALCFRLMVKYEVQKLWDSLLGWCYFARQKDYDKFAFDDLSHNKAICLAIIAAHKEQ